MFMIISYNRSYYKNIMFLVAILDKNKNQKFSVGLEKLSETLTGNFLRNNGDITRIIDDSKCILSGEKYSIGESNNKYNL